MDASRDERGAITLIAAFALVLLLTTAAIVVDLAGARNDRSDSQIAVDSAAAAAGIALGQEGSQVACTTAIGFLEANLDVTLSGHDCLAIPKQCTDATIPIEVVAAAGDIEARVVYPVHDAHGLMEATAAGRPTTMVTDADGHRCERIGVQITRHRGNFFGGFVGQLEGSTSVHSVVRASLFDSRERPINLLMLNPTECDAIAINGAGSSGILKVNSVTDPDTGEVFPGFIASDSNGTVGCGSQGVINVDGAGAIIQADGAPGCPEESVPGTGFGCGIIEVYAATGTGCVMPACSSGGEVNPPPSSLPRRITRQSVDHKWNCKATYPTLDLEPCEDAGVRDPWIDQLASSLGGPVPPLGYQDYVGSGFPCSVTGGPSTAIVVPPGNWWVDCPNLDVRRSLTFEGGNLVFTGDVTVQANGELYINTNNTETLEWSTGDPFDPLDHSARAGVAVFQNGSFTKSSGSIARILETTVYLGAGSELDFSGGSGEMTWTAPTEGPFEDLSLWSESSGDHGFAGSATLVMEGVYFAPYADMGFQGNGGTTQVEAQFITDTLSLGGNGNLVITPYFERMVLFEVDASSQMIR